MKRGYLYYIVALIWGIPGVTISIKGIKAYLNQPPYKLWWLLAVTSVVLVAFYLIFRTVVSKYSKRIATLPPKCSPLQTFPIGGWILLLFMMGLGVTLSHIPNIPNAFTASFYSGLGPMLIIASARFIINSCTERS